MSTEEMTLGEIGKELDRMLELRRLIWRGESWEKIHPLAQELADLTRIYTVKETKKGE